MELAKSGTRSPRGRQIGLRLKALRTAAKLSVQDLVDATGVGKSTINGIEAGQRVPHRSTLRSLFGQLGVSGQEMADILALAAAGSKSSGGWVSAYTGDISDEYLDYVAFEGDASGLMNYEPLLIPGLLQTEAYAKAVIRGMVSDAAEDVVNKRVEIRLKRQEILTKDAPVDLDVVLYEAALTPAVGGRAVMADQLMALTQQPDHVRVVLIPFAAGVHAGLTGPFVYMRFASPNATDLVYLESPAGAVFREAETDLKRFRGIFQHLMGRALSAEDSVAMIKNAARRHKRGTQ